MKLISFTLAIMACSGAIAQDLPPGVLLLSRVKAHMKEELHRLSALTCLETVAREHQAPGNKMKPLDTVRLEVLTNGDKELYASPGDRKFSEGHPIRFAGSGALEDGLFGPHLKQILFSDTISSSYKGEEDIGARRLARYDFRIPLLISGQLLRMPEGSGKVGLHGSFWADSITYDVVRLELIADEFPPNLPVTQMTTAIDYGRTPLGNGSSVLLPQTASFRLAKYSGETDRDQVEFTQCRLFGAESTIRFDAPDDSQQTARFASASVDDTARPLPGGLRIAVKLRSTISGGDAVGALIDGVVAEDVTSKRAVIVPAGSIVHGRVRRLERYTEPSPFFVVGLEFTELEVQGVRHVFYADLADIDSAPGVESTLSSKNTTSTIADPLSFGATFSQQTIERTTLPNLPGVASFFFKGPKLALPPDFRTVWKTLALKP